MRLSIIFLVLSITVAFAQKKIATLPLPADVQYAAVDRPGDIYLVLKEGTIEKFSKDGSILAKTVYEQPPQLFDPRDGVLAFAFFRETHRVDYLSVDLTLSDSHTINPEFAIQPWLACPSRNELWIMDSVDLSLKRTAATQHLIGSDLSWNGEGSIDNITYLREYQNFLFVLDHTSGILMINSMGKPVHQFREKDLTYFNFLGEELYYKKDSELLFRDLYTGETHAFTLPQPADFALVTDERLFLVKGRTLDIFEYKP